MQPTLDSSSSTDALELLSGKETREIVTPYAFGVAPELLGKKLASPTRRACAQLVDLSLIALLSKASALFLGFVMALTFLRASSHLSNANELTLMRHFLRMLATLIIFAVTLSLVPFISNTNNGEGVEILSEEKAGPILTTIEKFAMNACEDDQACLNNVAAEFGGAIGETTTAREEAEIALEDMLDGRGMDADQRSVYRATFLTAFDNARGGLNTPPVEANESNKKDDSEVITYELGENSAVEEEYSIIKWIKGLMSDLGLGFGWAALYYSVFTAWWKGHTVGKWLFNIKVLKIDGSVMTLWESFGRYGGYGAGLATGLLGFLQIYWDANRQAIQDKISETLVIYVDKTERD